MKGAKETESTGVQICVFIVAVCAVLYSLYMIGEKIDEKMDMKKTEIIKEESMRYQLVSEKLNEPKDSFYIDIKEDKYIVFSGKGEYIVDFNKNYSKIEHFVKVGPKKNE
ncbi:hypothetical protein [Bacillus pumilus]|uniref:hypothetical protein n=1 Tax=Bacillus TaxID=1386 RepID=UPI00211195E3|nr:hypothetical protein [Bacillus pumilus]UUD44629.1 hypothetical protein NPA43_19025 [Bacillus pumilus]